MVGSIFLVNQSLASIAASTRREINQTAGAAKAGVRMQTRRAISRIHSESFAARMRAAAEHIDVYA